MKTCTKCGRVLEFDMFTIDRQRKSGLRSSCKDCRKKDRKPEQRRKYNREYYLNNKDKYRRDTEEKQERSRIANRKWSAGNQVAIRNARNKRLYGITTEEYEDMFFKQNGVCSICGNPETAAFSGVTKNLAIDHCHDSNVFRGLLCQKCNTGLGNFEDNIDILASAISYLQQNYSRQAG